VMCYTSNMWVVDFPQVSDRADEMINGKCVEFPDGWKL